MHHVHVNPVKNRMYIFLSDGHARNAKAYVNQIEDACGRLAYNFSCVAVLDKKGTLRQSDMDLLFNTVDLIYAYGAGRIIVVRKNIDDSSFCPPELLYFQTVFSVENAADIMEAENILDQKYRTVRYNH